MVLPAIGAVVTTLISKGKFSFVFNYLRINWWLLIGILSIVVVYILSSVLQQLLLNVNVVTNHGIGKIPNAKTFLEQVALGMTLGGLSAVFEEVGWRGFLQSRVQSALPGYLFVGLCWAAFHFPQIIAGLIYQGHLIEGLVIHTVILVALGFLLCVLRDKSSSIITTSVVHGLFNSLIFTSATGVIFGGSQVTEGISWAVVLLVATMGSVMALMQKNKLPF
jgi:membrane protease YdiL (CAAX protease family)